MVLDAEDVFAKVGYAMLDVNNAEFQSVFYAWPVMLLARVIDMLCTPLPLVLQRCRSLRLHNPLLLSSWLDWCISHRILLMLFVCHSTLLSETSIHSVDLTLGCSLGNLSFGHPANQER